MHELNLTGLTCPMPLLKLKAYLKRVKAGERLIVTASDPNASADFHAWLNQDHYHMAQEQGAGGTFVFTIDRIA